MRSSLCRMILVSGILAAFGCRSREQSPEAALQTLRSEVRGQIPEEDRATTILSSVDRLDAELVSRGRQIETRRQIVQSLFADYDATDAELREALAAGRTEVKAFRKSLLDFHFGVREETTDQEWRRIAPLQSALIAARLREEDKEGD